MDKMHLAFKRAIEAAGGVPAMARIVNRTPANLYSLVNRERPCPAGLVLAAERGTGVSRHDLRPDIYPVEV